MRFDPWTLALQAINVLVLVWLLARFLFRPVADIIAARQTAANALLAEAEATRRQSAERAAELARQRVGMAAEGEHIADAARVSAEAERTAILRQADDAAAKMRGEAEQAMARERRTMREALERDAAELALTLARRLLARLPVQMLNQAFLHELGEALATHAERALLQGVPIEIRSAVPLDATAQSECRAMLQRLIGGTPQLTFSIDPTLLAGFELASPDLLIRNSWRVDLERLSRALHEDTDHGVAVA